MNDANIISWIAMIARYQKMGFLKMALRYV